MDPHQPTNGNATVDRKLWASAALNSAITLAEFIGGVLPGSLAPEVSGCGETEVVGQWP